MQDLVLKTFLGFADVDLGVAVPDDPDPPPPDCPQVVVLLRMVDRAAAAMADGGADLTRAQILRRFGRWLDGRLVRDSALSKARLLSTLLALRHEMERWLCRRHAFANLGQRTPVDRLVLTYRDGMDLGDVLHGLLEARLKREHAQVELKRQEFNDAAGRQLQFRLERSMETAA
ncbi:MAG: hypothetical protein KDG89_09555 [Geminicoccaceae bacterium]|nr:hypothetical protein [Geminicoccaceae bacterium]